MNTEQSASVDARAEAFAALGDPVRLRIVERLVLSDAMPSDLSAVLGINSNLLAHHLKVLEAADLVRRVRSEGDRRRTYVRLLTGGLPSLVAAPVAVPRRVLFVCTANSARSQLAALLWRHRSSLPAESAGTHPADQVSAGAVAAAKRHHLRLARGTRPQRLADVRGAGDLMVTVCDRAHEELADPAALHWSVPDPVPVGTARAFEAVVGDLDHRIHGLVDRFDQAS